MRQLRTESLDAVEGTNCVQEVSEQMFAHALERSTQAGTNDDTASLARTSKTTSQHAFTVAFRNQRSRLDRDKDAWPSMVFPS